MSIKIRNTNTTLNYQFAEGQQVSKLALSSSIYLPSTGNLLEGVELSAFVANDISHGLNRTLEGWRLERRPALQCGFEVYMGSVATEAAVHNTWSDVVYDTESYDLGGNIAAGVFTAPRDGLYSLNAGVRLAATSAGKRVLLRLYKNDETVLLIGPAARAGSNGVTNTFIGSDNIRLNEDDTVKVQIFQDEGSNIDIDDQIQQTWCRGRAIDELGDGQDELTDEAQATSLRLYSSCSRTINLRVW